MSSTTPKRYDAFLSYNSEDRPAIEDMERRLRAEGLTLYLELRELLPGREFQPALAEALLGSKACVMFLGPSGLGPWQNEELQVAIDTRVRDRDFHVIPVLLPGAERPRRGEVAHLEFLINASWVEFLQTLDDQKEFQRLVWGITGKKPEEAAERPFEGLCPYRGLEAFGPGDAKFFFGRENLTDWLVSELRREIRTTHGTRLLAVPGPSGSGKSSVVLAGLIPKLKAAAIDGSDRWTVATVRPGDDPLENLVVEVTARFLPEGAAPDLGLVQKLSDDLQAGERGLDRFGRLALRNAPAGERLVIVVDQFEEVFTYRPQDEQAKGRFERSRFAFFANLLHAVAAPGGRVAAVLTMRSDFLGECAAFPRLNNMLNAYLVQVGPMQEEELREAIARPAYLVGCEVEPDLTERLLADVRGQPGALPLMQFALTEVWKRRDVRKLTLGAYNDLGGVEGAIEHRANEIFRGFKPEEQELCRRIFLRLVQPGEGTEDTKRRVPYRELLPDDPARAAAVRDVVKALAARDARLVTTEGTDASDGAVEVAHEALIRSWTQLRKWVDAERAGLRIQRRMTEAAQEWADASPDAKEDFLYSGARLVVSREWAATHRDELNPIEGAFLAASEESERQSKQDEVESERRLREAAEARKVDAEAAAERQRRLGRRFLLSAIAAGVLAFASGGLALRANIAREMAKDSEDRAKMASEKADQLRKSAETETRRARAQERLAESRRLAALSDAVRAERLDVAMLLALEAAEKGDTLEARGSLQRSLDERPEVVHFLHVPEGEVHSVAVEPDGKIAAGYGKDDGGGVVLFDARGERLRPAPLQVNEGPVNSVAFGPAGKIAAGYRQGEKGGVIIFDSRGARLRPAPLQVKEGEVTSVAFGPAGQMAAGYRIRRTGGVVLFDARGERLRAAPLEVPEGEIHCVTFGSAGKIAAGYAGRDGGGVMLFDTRGERLRPAPLEVKEGQVSSVAFGPDGKIAAGYGRGEGVINRASLILLGDGAVAAEYHGGGTVLFDSRGERLRPAPLQVEEGEVTSVAFGAAGEVAAGYQGHRGGGVALFDVRGKRLRPAGLEVKEGEVMSVAFGPEGRIAAGYGFGGRGGVVLFDSQSQRVRAAHLAVKEGNVWGVAFGSAGEIAGCYGRRGTFVGGVVLFHASGERLRPTPLEVKEGFVRSVAVGPEGTFAAGFGGAVGGGVVLFDGRCERLRPSPLEVKEGEVASVAFGPEGKIAAGYRHSEKGGVIIFDSRGERLRPAPLEIKEGEVTSVAFGPEGKIAGGYGVPFAWVGGVVLFDARGERLRPVPLEVKEGEIHCVAFGPAGKIAAGYSGRDDGGVMLFDTQGERLRPAPLEVKEGQVSSVAFGPDGKIAAGYGVPSAWVGGVVLFGARGERLRPAPLEVKEGEVTSVAFGPSGKIAAGYCGPSVSGVVLFDAETASWIRKAGQTANRNFTHEEWIQFFSDRPYRRTIRSLPWPYDLSEAQRKQAEALEREHPEEDSP